MQLIVVIENPFPNVQVLKVYTSFEREGDVITPIELDNDICMMRWNHDDGWHCNGIDSDATQIIGNSIGKLRFRN